MMNKTLKEIFREKGISPSYTRTRIYYYLESSKSHPTADEIYRELVAELPTLSKTTVYNVLHLLIEKNMVEEINIGSNEKRYELNIENHSHFVCEDCKKIYDIPHIYAPIDPKEIIGFEVLNQEVNLKGICPTCRQK